MIVRYHGCSWSNFLIGIILLGVGGIGTAMSAASIPFMTTIDDDDAPKKRNDIRMDNPGTSSDQRVLVTLTNDTISAIIEQDTTLRTFHDELNLVGLLAPDGILNGGGSGQTTIFAMNEDAFTKYATMYPQEYQSYFTPDRNSTTFANFYLHRRQLLQWLFVTEDPYTMSEIFDGVRTNLENVNGNMTINPMEETLDGIPRTSIVMPDILAADGIIHVMDEIIVPPYLGLNLIGQCLNDQSRKFAFSTMAQLAIHGELQDEIDTFYDQGITFLVPANRRFNRAEIHVPTLLSDEWKEYTRDFVHCHMILNRNYYESAVFALHEEQDVDETLEVSYLGTNLWITTTEDRLRFQSIDLLLPDQVARNGIFHGMEFPLFPPFGSDMTLITGISTQYDTLDMYRLFVQCLLASEDIATMFDTTLTIFAPTREAFAFFNNEDFQRLLEPMWVRHSTEFLFNHIATPAMTREEMVNQVPNTITMLNGMTYDLQNVGTAPTIQNGPQEVGKVFFGDLIALDGYVHVMDSVLTPTHVSQSIFDQCQLDPDFSLLMEKIDFVRLRDLVDRDLPLTMLVIPNHALERVTILDQDLQDVLRQHIFHGLLFTDVIANATEITSVNDVAHTIERKGPQGEYLYIGGAYVYEGDVLARNGVMHKIDCVIGYEYPTVPPSISPSPTMTLEPTLYPTNTEPQPHSSSPVDNPPASQIQFCGDKPCVIPLAISCTELQNQYYFFGSCCHLEDIIVTGGCRITISSSGNCAWMPKCGECDPAHGCFIEYQTFSTDTCETDQFNVLNGSSDSPTALDCSSDSPNASSPSSIPSDTPSLIPTSPPTVSPSLLPNFLPDDSLVVSQSFQHKGVVLTATLSMLSLLLIMY